MIKDANDFCNKIAQSEHAPRTQRRPLLGVKRISRLTHGMSAFDGEFNRSTQHLLILLEEEVRD